MCQTTHSAPTLRSDLSSSFYCLLTICVPLIRVSAIGNQPVRASWSNVLGPDDHLRNSVKTLQIYPAPLERSQEATKDKSKHFQQASSIA